MKRILAFGDSNTWGYDPATGQRYDETIRWTGLLQKALGEQALILEEGLCGRTTVFEDTDRVGRNGLAALPSVLRRSEPLDAAIIMLGTNDCKQVFGASSQEIAAGMALCLAEISEYVKAENILLISPICLEEVALGTSYNDRSLAVSRELSQAYQQPAKLYGVSFLAASEVAKASRIDGEHLTESGHRALYEAVYPFIKMRILTTFTRREPVMKSILIKDTTREEREQIVRQSLWGSCGAECEFCSGCDNRGGGRIESLYQPYIDGLKEISEINEAYRAPFVK